jgi:hypothetical protein
VSGRWRALFASVLLAGPTACTFDLSPTSTAPPTPAATPTPTATPTLAPTASASSSPTATPEPTLSLALPEVTDSRVVSAAATPDGDTLRVTVSSTATERIDELVLRWHAELDGVLRLAPFTPSEDRIRDGGPPLHQEWTKWVVGPGEQGEPAGTISIGWGPLFPGATLEIPLVATRLGEGPVEFDLQLLAGNDLLSFEGGAPAELRVVVP